MHLSYLYDLSLPSRYAAAIQILSTCRALCESGVVVDVYVRELSGSEAECMRYYDLECHEKLRIRELPLGRGGRIDTRALRSKLETSDSRDRHVVLSRGESGLHMLTALASLTRPPNERHVYESHRLCYTYPLEDGLPRRAGLRRVGGWLKSRRIRGRESATLRKVDGVVCLTRTVQTALGEEFGLTRPCLVLPSGTATRSDSPPPDAERDIEILYAGKLDRRKGVTLLVDAMSHLPSRRAWVVGGTEQQVRDVAAHARGVAVGDRIVLPGYLPPGEIRRLYQRTRVGVCPLPAGVSAIADRFTSPLKILQMMALGVPIVASDLPPVRELLEDGRTALLVPPNDPRALAKGIQALLEDRNSAAALALRAREVVSAFSWQHRARHLLEFLESLA